MEEGHKFPNKQFPKFFFFLLFASFNYIFTFYKYGYKISIYKTGPRGNKLYAKDYMYLKDT